MTNDRKLSDFKIETYEERFVLILALGYFPVERFKHYQDTIQALSLRISRLECQPGGCPNCTGEPEDYND